ncbi:MAG: hypothetical protein PHE56_01755 [Bacteroidales bacterium]|nr:hypothetical protein [Bacteroidales bacterium]
MKKKFVVMIFCSITIFCNAQVNEQDSLALVALFNSTDGDNWTCGCNEGWLTSPVDEWYGVSVENGRVIHISLVGTMDCPSCGLNGIIPSEIGNLTALQTIQLIGNNNLSGSIPSEIGDLDDLLKLEIYNCNLTGFIPSAIANMSSIKELNLSENQLAGIIPPEFGNMLTLEKVNISVNQLSGSIPEEIGNLTSLIEIDLSNNQLSGSIPLEIWHLSNLRHLYLTNNQLTGNISPEIVNMISLMNLYIANNILSGSIPSEVGNLTSLIGINLSGNQLTGNIPIEFWNLGQLMNLYLSNNLLSGYIPPEINNLTLLRNLNLSSNQLSGNIPSEIGNITTLNSLNLSNNQLTGSIPYEIGNLTHLNSLNLSYNQFSGEIPDNIFNISLINNIVLNNNSFTSIPDLSSSAQLDIFKIENNNLEFNCLEPNQSLTSIDEYTYSPQDSINIEIDTTVISNSSFIFETNCGGENNQFQWYFNNDPIEGATESTYALNSVIEADQGVYTCAVTNTVVNSLTIWRTPITLHVNTSGLEDINIQSIIIEKSGGNLLITNLHDNCNIYVYTVDGLLLHCCISEKDGTATIDMSKFPKGVLILKIGNYGKKNITKKIINY